ncbi:hypothetical protein OSI40_25355, partial [Mycobacterium ulcerans]
LYIAFHGKFRGTQEQANHLHESPAAMTISLVVLAILSIVGGWVGIPEVLHGRHLLAAYLAPVFRDSEALAMVYEVDHVVEIVLMLSSTLLVIVMI